MDKDTLIRQLMATFVTELDDNVEALDRDLLALEKAPPEEHAGVFKKLYRTVHSLKGAARSVDLTVLEGACHHLEDVFGAIQGGRLKLADTFGLLFATVDGIRETGDRLRSNQSLAGAPLEQVLPQLVAAANGHLSASPVVEQAAKPETVKEVELPAMAVAKVAKSTPTGEEPARGVVTGQPAPPPATKGPMRAVPTMPSAGSVVRVAAEKLDSLLSQSGELLVARRRVESRLGEIAALRDLVAASKTQWREIQKPVRKLLQDNGPADDKQAHDHARSDARATRTAQEVAELGEKLRRLEKDLDRVATVMVADVRQLDQACSNLESEVHRVRMLPFSEACQGLERAARSVAQASGKEVELVIEGGDVELDRSILEGLKDPLLHLVRNAVDHGVQPPRERQQAGKSPRGRVTVAAAMRGAQVEVVVSDDGRGLDVEAVRRQVRKRAWAEPTDERELVRMIFQPGFSTAPIVTDVSGRGVGLDVVQGRLEALHGTVEVAFEPGQGTRFIMAVPLTLTTLRVLLFSAGGQTFGLASTAVEKLVRIGREDFRSVQGREVIFASGPPVPLVSLVETLGISAPPTVGQGKLPAIVISAAGDRAAFVVEEMLVEQEVVVKNLGQRILRVRNVAGATLLPTGRVALVLNAATLVRAALKRGSARQYAAALAEAAPEQQKRLIVADDSVTTRSLVKSILEASGYNVSVAFDGAEAWRLLEEQGADLMVSDVEMPRMDGFELTSAIRASQRFHELPVVLVTSLDSEAHKARGAEVGADAYLVKSAFDQRRLLETIGQLL